MFENPNDILTPEEAMEALMVGKNTIYELLRSGAIPAFRVGSRWKIPRKAIDRFIDEQIGK